MTKHKPLGKAKLVKGVGCAEDNNSRYRESMEDKHLFADEVGKKKKNMTLACVFDGHGGIQTATYLETNFQKVFESNVENIVEKGGSMENALKSTFSEIDNQMKSIQYDGATAAVVVIVKEATARYVYSANCGDARAVLVKKNGTGVRLSYDHKVGLPEEIDRITNAGGFIAMGRVNAILAVSRAFGDHGVKNLVISEPFISKTLLTADDVYVIVACDGVWDVVQDNQAAECVLKKSKAQDAANALKDLSMTSGTTDNVTVLVVQL